MNNNAPYYGILKKRNLLAMNMQTGWFRAHTVESGILTNTKKKYKIIK